MTFEHYLPEIVIGGFLAGFGILARSWAGHMREGQHNILRRVDGLSKAFNHQLVVSEGRIARIEEKVENMDAVCVMTTQELKQMVHKDECARLRREERNPG